VHVKTEVWVEIRPFAYAATAAITRSNLAGKTRQGLFCRVTTYGSESQRSES